MISYKQVSVSNIQVKNPALPFKESEIERMTEYLSISKTAFPPLVVKRLGPRLSCHTYELLTGYQQYYAAQKAKLDRINALILEENDTPEIEAAILSQIQSHSPISEVTEEQTQEQTTEPLAFDSPASNSNKDSIKTSHLENQRLAEQNQATVQSLEEMQQQNQQLAEQNQATIQSLKEIQQQNQQLAKQNQAIFQSLKEMQQQSQQLAKQNQAMHQSLKEMQQQNQQLAEQNQAMHQSLKEIQQQNQQPSEQNQRLSEQNRVMRKVLQEMQVALEKINITIAEFPASQVSPSTSIETPSSSPRDKNQPELKTNETRRRSRNSSRR
ncbi:ParB N-terminal domain-containing protein [Thermosynechococcus sp. FA-CM-4201]